MTPQPVTPRPVAPAPQEKYTLPTIALALSGVGLCFCPTAIVGMVLAIVALFRISKEPQLSGKGLAIAALVFPLALVPIVGIEAAIAIPNFIRFQTRAKQSECKVNLKSMLVAQRAFRSENGRWAVSFDELDFRPEKRNRYSYFLSEKALFPADASMAHSTGRDEIAALRELHVFDAAGEDRLVMACVGNVDNDATLDAWVIDGESGQPSNVRNDVSE